MNKKGEKRDPEEKERTTPRSVRPTCHMSCDWRGEFLHSFIQFLVTTSRMLNSEMWNHKEEAHVNTQRSPWRQKQGSGTNGALWLKANSPCQSSFCQGSTQCLGDKNMPRFARGSQVSAPSLMLGEMTSFLMSQWT